MIVKRRTALKWGFRAGLAVAYLGDGTRGYDRRRELIDVLDSTVGRTPAGPVVGWLHAWNEGEGLPFGLGELGGLAGLGGLLGHGGAGDEEFDEEDVPVDEYEEDELLEDEEPLDEESEEELLDAEEPVDEEPLDEELLDEDEFEEEPVEDEEEPVRARANGRARASR